MERMSDGNQFRKNKERRSSILQRAVEEGIVGRWSLGVQEQTQQQQQRPANKAKLPSKLPVKSPAPSSSSASASRGPSKPTFQTTGPANRAGFMHSTQSSTSKTKPRMTKAVSSLCIPSRPSAASTLKNKDFPSSVNPRVTNVALSKGKNTNFYRTASWDSNTWRNSFMTPGMTPIGSKTPGSLRRSASQINLREPCAKTLKAPSSKDKVLISIVNCISDILRKHNVPLNVDNLKNMSSCQYYGLVRNVASRLLAPNYFNSSEDIVSQIHNLAQYFGYPGTLSKSHLKSANAPNSWPSCLMFLLYLCARLEHYESEIHNATLVSEISSDFTTLALPHMMNVIWTSDGVIDSDNCALLDEELKNFEAKICQSLMGESVWSMEELEEERDRLETELKKYQDMEDPTKSLKQQIHESRQILEETQGNINECKQKIQEYKNLEPLRDQIEKLKAMLHSRNQEVALLNEKINNQPVDKTTQKSWITQLGEIKSRRRCLQPMLVTLKEELQNKSTMLEEYEKKFYEVLREFTVVEIFNLRLSKLGMERLFIKSNPLTGSEFLEWLKGCDERLKQAISLGESFIETWTENKISYVNELEEAQQEVVNAEEQLNRHKIYLKRTKGIVKQKWNQGIHDLSEKRSAVENLNKLLFEKSKEVEKQRKELELWKNLEAEKQKQYEESEVERIKYVNTLAECYFGLSFKLNETNQNCQEILKCHVKKLKHLDGLTNMLEKYVSTNDFDKLSSQLSEIQNAMTEE